MPLTPLVPLWGTLQSAQKVCGDKWDLSRKSCPLSTLLYNCRCGIQTSVHPEICWKPITHIWRHICNNGLWYKNQKKKRQMCSRSMFMYMEIMDLFLCYQSNQVCWLSRFYWKSWKRYCHLQEVNPELSKEMSVCFSWKRGGEACVWSDHCAQEHNMHFCMQEQVHTQWSVRCALAVIALSFREYLRRRMDSCSGPEPIIIITITRATTTLITTGSHITAAHRDVNYPCVAQELGTLKRKSC